MLINSLLSTLPAWFKTSAKEVAPVTYGTELEQYIIANNPQSTYDVERLTIEFDRKQARGIWW